MTVNEARQLFPHVRRVTYFNHAATSPLSTPVLQAIKAYLDERHESNIENYFDFMAVLKETRERIGTLLGTQADRVEFAPNTSYALNVLAEGYPWRAGDRIAVPSCEFPANVHPFMHQRRHGVEVDFIPHDEGVITPEAVEATLRRETKLLTISWVQYLSGFRADLHAIGEICRDRDVIFCVDAIQGLGALQLDVEELGIDFLACGGHKWIMATQGIGFLYVSEALQERLTPMVGWLNGPVDWDHLDEYDLTFHDDAARFRLGTVNSIGVAALHAALGLHHAVGPAACERQVLELSRMLSTGLAERGFRRYGSRLPEHASGIVSIAHPDVEGFYTFLKERGIHAATRQQMLRFSPTFYNSKEEVEHVLEVMETFPGRA